MLEISEEPLRGGGDKNERTAEAENDGKEGKLQVKTPSPIDLIHDTHHL